MAQKNRFYHVHVIGQALRKSYPLREVKFGTLVQAMESAPRGSVDVVDVRLTNGKVKSVYSFQLEKPVKKPLSWGR
jgi:hypothetical protein